MTTLLSEIVFLSEAPEYVQQVLIPALGDSVECSGSTRRFPFARQVYGDNLGFMLLGAIILLIFGFAQVVFSPFPDGAVLRVKNYISDAYRQVRLCVLPPKASNSDTLKDTSEPMEEVVKEEGVVTSLVQKFLNAKVRESGQNDVEIQNDSEVEMNPLDELPPVLLHKLRKVYPALGGLPSKVALEFLDLHVPKGQVLGLLGKNGAGECRVLIFFCQNGYDRVAIDGLLRATSLFSISFHTIHPFTGKTTALKILSISHAASSCLALVAGYDASCEETSVFERLGNCPQFDIVWPGQSVRYHLEFFASLKGLPSARVPKIAASIARAVGLGAPEVYSRHSGQLSAGMRRRPSIDNSLIGAPEVLLLDEPSTGFDPSTRNSIGSLSTLLPRMNEPSSLQLT
jgi:ABC-type Na+ transport system ATPase subunit NatA